MSAASSSAGDGQHRGRQDDGAAEAPGLGASDAGAGRGGAGEDGLGVAHPDDEHPAAPGGQDVDRSELRPGQEPGRDDRPAVVDALAGGDEQGAAPQQAHRRAHRADHEEDDQHEAEHEARRAPEGRQPDPGREPDDARRQRQRGRGAAARGPRGGRVRGSRPDSRAPPLVLGAQVAVGDGHQPRRPGAVGARAPWCPASATSLGSHTARPPTPATSSITASQAAGARQTTTRSGAGTSASVGAQSRPRVSTTWGLTRSTVQAVRSSR